MSAAKSIGRRLFSRAAIGVPTALKFGGSGALLPSQPPAPNMAYAGSNGAQTGVQVAKQAALNKAWAAIRIEHKSEREMEDLRDRRRYMMGGLDPDLAVLNSMSLGRRVQIQIEREKAVRDRANTLSARIMRRFGIDPEEFQ